MIYQLLADIVVLIHLLFILFVLFGGLLGLWRRWVLWLHLPAVIWGAAIEFANWICPLTLLENRLHTIGGEGGYSGAFIDHYLIPLLYPSGLTPGIQMTLGIAVLLLNINIYVFVWWRLRTGRRLRRISPLQRSVIEAADDAWRSRARKRL